MSPEEPAEAHEPGSTEGNGGRAEPPKAERAVRHGTRSDERHQSDQTQNDGVGLGAPGADASAAWIASDKVRVWARRFFAPSDGGSGETDSGRKTPTHETTARLRHPVAPHWPGAGRTVGDAEDAEDSKDNDRGEADDPGPSTAGTREQYQDGHDAMTDQQPAVEESDDMARVNVNTQQTQPAMPVTSPYPTAPAVPLPAPEAPESSEPAPEHLVTQPTTWPPLETRRRQRRPRKARTDRRGRTVSERLRHISPWSVLKVAALFYICVVITVLVASAFLWQIGRSTETIDQMESFVSRLFSYGECVPRDEVEPGTSFQLDDDCPEGSVLVGGFEIDDGTLFRSVLIGGGVFVAAATLGTVLLVVLFNLLSDVTGGVRYTVARGSVGTASGSTHRDKQR
jgi:hypothetical protein